LNQIDATQQAISSGEWTRLATNVRGRRRVLMPDFWLRTVPGTIKLRDIDGRPLALVNARLPPIRALESSMLPFALCMILIGAVLGLWFKAVVLVPVIGAVWLFIAVGGRVAVSPETSLLLLFVSVAVWTQFGYLVGLLARGAAAPAPPSTPTRNPTSTRNR
jgi:hypothetical protein